MTTIAGSSKSRSSIIVYIEIIYASVRTGKDNSNAVMKEPLPPSSLVDWTMERADKIVATLSKRSLTET